MAGGGVSRNARLVARPGEGQAVCTDTDRERTKARRYAPREDERPTTDVETRVAGRNGGRSAFDQP